MPACRVQTTLLHRNGGRHDIYINPQNGKKQPIPRHNEIETLLNRIRLEFYSVMCNANKKLAL